MPPAAGVVVQCDRNIPAKPPLMTASEAFAKDAIIAWFRGEFAAANAIIDALCSHLKQLDGCGATAAAAEDYESAFAAIHRRRLNWIPILQMQKYYSIADVTAELTKVAEKKREEADVDEKKVDDVANGDFTSEKEKENNGGLVDEDGGGGEVVDDSPPHSEITDSGSQEVQHFPEHVDICSNHEECEERRAQIKMTKGFVNVARGLKLYEDVFTDVELSKLNDFVSELQVAGRNGELSGETFLLYNQQMKGNKRELIQLGVSIFGQIKEDTTNKFQKSYIEPIPALLQSVIDHLIQWRLIQENKKPNSCIINFFDEGDYSQPFVKPPHLDQPLSTLLLSESTMVFGRSLVSDSEGNYRGPLLLSLKEGSLLVMRGNSSDTARHAMCSSPNKRVSITFFRVRTQANSNQLPEMTLCRQPIIPTPCTMPNSYDIAPQWGLLQSPVVMLAPVRPLPTNPRQAPRDGTGVFLPWTMGPRRPAKHLPPRAQRARLLALPSPHDTHNKVETSSDSGVNSP
ncbi:hypothetical protein BUALT_Bualt13G0010400 [Buddleja alternifolia]|uniref:Fe2OG dioxygenase domain-containing protein n=1 Tax=Buddleja alternifolia TaxID=168488 RepID=A0AAV6WKK2_9LAMI|nr:hypothetical protein BUALT_Bualt13G0010400 [Buddleja alternifolia]